MLLVGLVVWHVCGLGEKATKNHHHFQTNPGSGVLYSSCFILELACTLDFGSAPQSEEGNMKRSACDFSWNWVFEKESLAHTSILFCVCTKGIIEKTLKTTDCLYIKNDANLSVCCVMYATGRIGRSKLTIKKAISRLVNANLIPLCQWELINVSLPHFETWLGSTNESCCRFTLSWLCN